MKRLFASFFCFALLIWSFPVFALPALQLDIGGGYYNTTGDSRYNDETIISQGDVFTLYALMQKKKGTPLTGTYTISMALYPHMPLTSPDPDFGSFIFDGLTIDVAQDMIYGNPGLPSHGVFDTYYTVRDFTFNADNKVGKYNTQDNPGQFDRFSTGAGLYYAAFSVDTTNLSDDVSIHFDLFGKSAFAPFSHDADAQSDPPPSPPPSVPIPGAVWLLGTGLIGLIGIRRRFKK